MASIISGMAPPRLDLTTAAVSAENAVPANAGPAFGPVVARSSIIVHRLDAGSAPRYGQTLRYQQVTSGVTGASGPSVRVCGCFGAVSRVRPDRASSPGAEQGLGGLDGHLGDAADVAA